MRLTILLQIKNLSKQILKLIKLKSLSRLATDLITISLWIYLLKLSQKTLKLLFNCRRLRSFLRKRIKMWAGRVSTLKKKNCLKKWKKKKFQLKKQSKKILIMLRLPLKKSSQMLTQSQIIQVLLLRKRIGIRLTKKSLKTWKLIR